MKSKKTPQELYDRVCSIHRTPDGTYKGFIDGKARNEKPCGFCGYAEHKGTLSRDLLKSHQCLAKNCHHLVRYSESAFFKERELRNADKKMKKLGLDVKSNLTGICCVSCGRKFTAHKDDNALSLMKRLKSAKWVKLSCGSVICWKCAKEIKREGLKEGSEDAVNQISTYGDENSTGVSCFDSRVETSV